LVSTASNHVVSTPTLFHFQNSPKQNEDFDSQIWKRKTKIQTKSVSAYVPYDLWTEEAEEVATAREFEARD
jgi:hypothetical protein